MNKGRQDSIWKTLGAVIMTFLIVAVVFVLVSLVLASTHNQSIVTEWQSWFGIAESASETVQAVIKL